MLPNEILQSIQSSMSQGDTASLKQHLLEMRKYLLNENAEMPAWGWRGFIKKSEFELLLSKCPNCDSDIDIISKGIWGFEARCPKCPKSDGINGQGPDPIEAMESWSKACRK